VRLAPTRIAGFEVRAGSGRPAVVYELCAGGEREAVAFTAAKKPL